MMEAFITDNHNTRSKLKKTKGKWPARSLEMKTVSAIRYVNAIDANGKCSMIKRVAKVSFVGF